MRVRRRLGSTPRERGSLSGQTCPDIFELEDGRVATIGSLVSEEDGLVFPEDAELGEDDVVVILSREALMDARPDLFDL